MASMPETLGVFLRARRAQLTPAEVGLPAGRRRRVPGLRREEVAMLAGISTEYYLRLEQGRHLNPSAQILAGLAAALRLDDEAAGYLHRLAHPAPATQSVPASQDASQLVRLQALIDSWPLTAATVQDPCGRVVAANRLAAALCPAFDVGANTLRAAFLDPTMRRLYVDWDEMTIKTVAGLRTMYALDSTQPELAALIDELRRTSDRFRELWARRDVRSRTNGFTRFDHPEVGLLELRYEKMLLPEPQRLMVVYHAEPGSEDERRLRRLAPA